MLHIDHELGIRQVVEKLARTEQPRHRRMLEVIRDHMIAENDGDVDRIMETISPHAAYHTWATPEDIGAKGIDGVREYYEGFFATKAHFFENDCQRIVVDDDGVLTEAVMRMIKPGAVLNGEAFGPGSGAFEHEGVSAFDPSAHYLLENRVVIIWVFDDDLLLVGEDAYAGAANTLRTLSDDELPAAYRELLART